MTTFFPLSPPAHALSLQRTLGLLLGGFAPAAVIERTLQVLRASSTRDEPRTASTPASDAHAATATAAAAASSPKSARVSDEAEIAVLPEASLSMEQLVRDHADAVYRVALSVTRDPSLAEDASQDALIKAWEALPSYRGEAPLRHWILRITHNVSISLLRKRREEVIAPFDMPEEGTARGAVERRVHERMAIDRFKEALGQLDGLSRSIVVLREVEGLSYAEISDVLDLPLPTVRTRLLRARRQLAAALDGWQP